MTRQLRTTLALTLSLLLAIFTICQAHAMATMAVSGQPVSSVTAQPADIMSKQPQLPDEPAVLALAQSYPSSHDAFTLIVGGAAERAQGDPPPRLRFQRFLE